MVNLSSYLMGLAPARFAREWGQKLTFAIGSVGDVILDGFQLAILCRFPELAPEDALPRLGDDRLIYRGLTETTASYRTRLMGTWDAWEEAGTAPGVVHQLEAYGFAGIVHIAASELPGEVAARPADWSRFWLIAPAGSHPWTISVPTADQTAVRELVGDWKSAGCVLVAFVAMLSGRLWDWPDDGYTWDDATADVLHWGDSSALRF